MELEKFSGKNVNISRSAVIGKNVKIGDNTTIYDNVVIEDDSVICNDCVIGEPLTSYYSNLQSYINPATIIKKGALIRSHSIIYASCIIDEYFQCGHRVTIRENMEIGKHCSVGTLCDLQGNSEIGNYTRLHSNVHIGMNSKIGNYCWIFPYTVFTNDPTPPSNVCIGATVGDYTVIATHCLLLPNVTIGSNCLIGAFSSVTKNVEDFKVVIGSPGKIVKDIRDIKDKITGEPHYPWPERFGRGMPWQEMGYKKWIKSNNR